MKRLEKELAGVTNMDPT